MPSSRPLPPKVPQNWPTAYPYLTHPSYSKSLPPGARASLIVPMSKLPVTREILDVYQDPSRRVKILPIDNASHPAHRQSGLFAASQLTANSFVVEYLGYVHDDNDTDEQSDYDLSLDREMCIGIDAGRAAVGGNEARFINDYRGVSEKGPNAEFREVWAWSSRDRDLVEKRMGVFVLAAGASGKRAKGIAKGEEILVSYGKGFWKGRGSGTEQEEDRCVGAA